MHTVFNLDYGRGYVSSRDISVLFFLTRKHDGIYNMMGKFNKQERKSKGNENIGILFAYAAEKRIFNAIVEDQYKKQRILACGSIV